MTEPSTPAVKRHERSIWPLIVAGWLAVMIVDAGGSLVSVRTGFPYGYFAIPSFVVYAAVGIAARARGGSITSSALAGLGVALFDTTVGWWISWVIGPGRMPTTTAVDLLVILLTIKLVLAVDTVFAVTAGAAWSAMTAGRITRK